MTLSSVSVQPSSNPTAGWGGIPGRLVVFVVLVGILVISRADNLYTYCRDIPAQSQL